MTDERRFPIQRGPSIPWAMIAPYQDQARRNHGQTLERLAERGGLDPTEALAVLECRDCPHVAEPGAVDRLTRLSREHGERERSAEIARQAAELAEARADRDAACGKEEHLRAEMIAQRDAAREWKRRAERLEAALRALTNNPHMDLAGAVYEVRERERLGWDGPSVVAWSKAVTDAKAALERP